jgi:hypothetical protein
MQDNILRFIDVFNEELPDLLGSCYLARPKERQLIAIEMLTSLRDEALNFKQEALAKKDDDLANVALSLEKIIGMLDHELKMYVALKEDKSSEAWDYLVTAQDCLQLALTAHNRASSFEGYEKHLLDLEKVLFPKQMFLSPGMVVKSRICSICGQEYDECEHVKGRVYSGKPCVTQLKDVEVREISIVDEPASKRRRIFFVK